MCRPVELRIEFNKNPTPGAATLGGAAIGRVSTAPLRPTLSNSVAAPHRSIEPTLEDFAHLMRLRLLVRRTQGNTKAAVADAVRRIVPAAVRRPTSLGGGVPTAATAHAVRGGCRPRWVCYGTCGVIFLPILTPFSLRLEMVRKK